MEADSPTDMRIEEFLRTRGIPEETINHFVEQKIDSDTVPLIPDDELKRWLPKYGDGIAILNFCKKKNSIKKDSLIEKLRIKMEQKRKSKPLSINEPLSTKKERKKKQTRIIEIGWLCTHPKLKELRQVRAKFGGGTRRIPVDKHTKCHEILDKARDLYFPGGMSTKGPLKNFETELLDYKSHKCDLDLTIGEMYDISALTTLRFYLSTLPKNGIISVITEEEFTEEAMSSPKELLNSDSQDVSSSNPPDELRRSARLMERGPLIDFYEYFGDTANEVEYQSDFVHDDNFTTVSLPDEVLGHQTNDNIQTLVIHRSNVFEDLIKAFEQDFFDGSKLKIEMILPNGQSEMAEDIGGVFRDALSEFWNTFYEKCTVGTTLRIPYLRHDFGEIQWKAVAKIFLKGYTSQKYFPIKLAPVFLNSCFNVNINEDELVDNFLHFLCDVERDLLNKALSNFSSVEIDDLNDFFTNMDAKWYPTENNFKQLMVDMAHKELIQKPPFVAKCFSNEISSLGEISFSEIQDHRIKITPTVKNCLSKISIDETVATVNEKKIFGFIKKFIKEADERTRMAFFRFCTGSDLPINNINVTFNDTDGVVRMPIAHTCTGMLQVPQSYEDFVSFRSEINSLLQSNIWIMDIV